MQSPGLAAQAQALGQYARYDSFLPPHLSELAILVTARYWSSGFEWVHHVPIALDAGVPPEAVTAIGKAQQFVFADRQMQIIFDASVELHMEKNIRDQTYQAALDTFGLQACVDLVGICGYYTLISMTINTFDVPDGDGPALPKLNLRPHQYFAN